MIMVFLFVIILVAMLIPTMGFIGIKAYLKRRRYKREFEKTYHVMWLYEMGFMETMEILDPTGEYFIMY